MVETADAVVVGAGLNGAATAFFLLRLGLRRVTILESDLPGAGASGDDVGLLRAHYDNRPETELAAKSLPYFRNWKDLTGDDCEWARTGFFRFVEAHELDNMRRNILFQREFGERVDVLSGDDLRQIAPQFRSDDIGAVLHEPDSGVANNMLAVRSLLKIACARGASLRPYTRATAIRVASGRVAGVVTSDVEISTPAVVLAAGAASATLAASCGIALPLADRPIRIAEILPPQELRIPGCYMDPISDSWITPRKQNRALISVPPLPSGAAHASEDGGFSRDAAAAGFAPVNRRLPGIDQSTIARWWTRADCYAPDGKPVIGAIDAVAGLFLNSGGAGKGHKTAPAAGLALGELIVDGAARSADLTPFAPSRFEKPLRPWSDSEYGKRVIG